MSPATTAAIAALNPRGATATARPARYALELRPDQSAAEVESAALAVLAEFGPRIAPLSPADHAVLVLELLTRTLHGTPPPTAFAAGYALADEFQLRTAEPDLPTGFFPEMAVSPEGDSPPPGTPTEAAFTFPFCFVDPENLPSRWALDRLRVPEAWAFSTAQGHPSRGQGTVIAQPDTGVTQHAELAGVVRVDAWDVLDDDADPTDPLTGLNPGHGTGTASVVVSPETLEVAGSAPAASHMPIRAITTVVEVSQVAVAEAIGYAVDHAAHVITMSLGGLPAAALQHAVQRAVAADVIVLAAAGNCVRTVVWPARYDECIAVAATNAADQAWRGTCRGSAVDISAPGQNVLKANVNDDNTAGDAVGQGQGTSFSVALTAGVAALWLAHHGRADLIAAAHARGETLQAMFLRLLRATARRPAGWNAAEMGAGIADARALLAASFDAGPSSTAAAEPVSSVARLVAETIGPAASDDPDLDWVRFGPELAATMLQIQLARLHGADEAVVPPAVSRQLAGSVANPRLREHLGLDADTGG